MTYDEKHLTNAKQRAGKRRKEVVRVVNWAMAQEKNCTNDAMKARLLEELFRKVKEIDASL